MHHAIALASLAFWGPIVLALIRFLGPRRGAAIGLLGGFLLLPRSPMAGWSVLGVLSLDKRTIPGLAALLGVALFDHRRLIRFRFKAVDLAAIGFVLVPLLARLGGGSGPIAGSVAQSWIHLVEWGLPYLIGRLYFANGEGPRSLGTAVAVAGFLTIPLVAFEAILGPDWYLAGRVYGIGSHELMTTRLGGWRPETLLSNGLELAEWMALAASLATWMWICSGWKPAPLPTWLPAPALVLASLAVRGVYGYAVLGIGLAATGATRLVRIRLFLMVLSLVPPAYLAARISGLWGGGQLVGLARAAGRESTTASRIAAEGENVAAAKDRGLLFGEGGRYHDWAADGRWLATLRGSGLVGVAFQYAAILGPGALLIWRRKGPPAATSPEMGLALFAILHAIDSLHNTSLIVPVPLLCGALAGASAVGSDRPGGARFGPVRAGAGAGHATYRVGGLGAAPAEPAGDLGPVATVLAIACLLYVFGHAPVTGHEGVKFAGGLGSALLFAGSGAAAGSLRSSPARSAALGLAFAALGVSFNLALHPSTRPTWSSDILQGMALSGVAVALARPRGGIGVGVGGFGVLAAAGASWWAFGVAWRPFSGSQYLFFSGDSALSPFPVAPWVTLAALGAILARTSTARASAMAAAFAGATALAWAGGWASGPPSKIPMNPTYALLGAAVASAAFAGSGPIRRWAWSREASDWLGRRWLAFFYIHLAVALGLGRAGLVRPWACWTATAAISIAATWIVSAASDRVRGAFRRPASWVVLASVILAVGLIPGIPPMVVQAIAGGAGLLFATRSGELASLILGSTAEPPEALGPEAATDRARHLAKLALIVVVLGAPELLDRLPPPIGTGSRPGGPSPVLATPSR